MNMKSHAQRLITKKCINTYAFNFTIQNCAVVIKVFKSYTKLFYNEIIALIIYVALLLV